MKSENEIHHHWLSLRQLYPAHISGRSSSMFRKWVHMHYCRRDKGDRKREWEKIPLIRYLVVWYTWTVGHGRPGRPLNFCSPFFSWECCTCWSPCSLIMKKALKINTRFLSQVTISTLQFFILGQRGLSYMRYLVPILKEKQNFKLFHQCC